jgi:hypothetical protein
LFRETAARAAALAPSSRYAGYRLLDRRLGDAFERRFMRCSVTVVRGCFLTYSRETKRPSTAFRSKVISVAMASAPFCGSLNFADRGEPCHLTTSGTRSPIILPRDCRICFVDFLSGPRGGRCANDPSLMQRRFVHFDLKRPNHRCARDLRGVTYRFR